MRRLAVLLLVAACTSGHATSKPTPVQRPTVWLCSPAMHDDPCDVPLDTSVMHADGTTSRQPLPTTRQPVDCFYVYPTVSEAQTINAPLRVEAAEKRTATAQVAPFSSVCRVFAPVYRQLTVHALVTGEYGNAKARELSHADVVSAWHDYLGHNPSRRFVLIGHSQGTLELLRLMQEEIDGHPDLQNRLVSALLLGGMVKVPPGKVVGGDLLHVPLCTTGKQHGCVVTYNTFDTTPPATSLFGRPDPSRGLVGACANPARLTGSDKLLPVFPAGARTASVGTFPGSEGVKTDFVSYPDYLTAECKLRNGFGWLQVDVHRAPRDTRPATLPKPLGPVWGLHLIDVNVALGNLVQLVRLES
jgi:hypothetical protein